MNGPDISYLAAVAGGLISFLSPCVLPLVPAYLSYMAGAGLDELTDSEDAAAQSALLRRTLTGAFAFVFGFSTVFIALGATASAISPIILQNKIIIGQVAGVIIVLLGLHYMGAFRFAFLDREARLMPATLGPQSALGGAARSPAMRVLGPYFVGLAFAFGWTPCIGPILATILSIAAMRDSMGYGVSLLAAYSLGLGLPFIASAFAVRAFMAFSGKFRRHMHKVEIAAGVLLVTTGILIFSGSLERIAFWLIDMFPFLAKFG